MKMNCSYPRVPVLACTFALLAFSLFPVSVADASPVTFTYQGRVRSGGVDFNGAGQFKFALVTSTNTSRQALATANMGGIAPNQFVSTVSVNNAGSGYTVSVPVTFTGGGGSGASATANVSGGLVTSITVLTPGSGYSSAPVASVAPPPDNILFSTYWSNDGTSINGSQPGAFVSVPVSNGLFTVVLGDTALANMGVIDNSLFLQPNLELRVWFNDGVNGFSALSPVQRLTPAPYAIAAQSAGNLTGTLPASQLTGTIPAGQVVGAYSNAVTFANGSNSFAGTFSGNGAGLTNVAASALALISTNLSITSWGGNTYGQRTVPPDLTDITVVSAGSAHSLALRANGTVVAWGAGLTNNPLADGDVGQSIVPPGLSNVIAISAGHLHSLALRSNGTVVAWGAGTTVNPTNSVESGQSMVPAGLSNVIALAAGYVHSLALRSNGLVVAWGAGTSNNPTDNINLGQSIVPVGLSNVIAVSAGLGHSLALRSDGIVVAWGAGATNSTNATYNWGQSIVPPSLSNVVAIAAGALHSLALRANGTVVAWGLGTSNVDDGLNFGQSIVPAGLSNVVAITATALASFALKADGTVVAWGDNQLGETNVPPALDNVVSFDGGCIGYHVLALRRHSTAPVAWLNSDNTFNGNMQVNGDVRVSGELTAGGDLRLSDANLWLRSGADTKSGLGWFGSGKSFAGYDVNLNPTAPDGPVLFGFAGGALGTTTNGQKLALAWDGSQHLGIGVPPTPTAKVSLGSDSANSKLLIYDTGALSGSGSYGFGATNSQFRFHLGGSSDRFAFLNSITGTELFTITGTGSVGVGTNFPNVALHVRGDVKLGTAGDLYAPGSVERLRMVRGRIGGDGSVQAGSGFTVTKNGTGDYTINFSPSFATEPAITASCRIGGNRVAGIFTASNASARIQTYSGASLVDQDFYFIAVGPR